MSDSTLPASSSDRMDPSLGEGKVLVTGAAGHLGANLVRRLLADGQEVRVLLRDNSDNAAADGLAVERYYGDLRNPAQTLAAVDGCRRIFHCAARLSTSYGNRAERREIFECNVLGTRHLLRAAQQHGVRRVVVTGSFSAVGYDTDNPSTPSTEDTPFFPFDRCLPYARSKVLAEHESLKAVADGLDVVIATSCAIVGPHDYKPSRMGQTLLDFARGKLHAYIPGGFEFVAAADIVEGHILSMERGRTGQKYTFSTQFLNLEDVLHIFQEVTRRRRPRLKLPAKLMAGAAEISDWFNRNLRPGAPQRLTPGAINILRMRRHADLSKARMELNYRPSSIRDAIERAYEDFVRRGLLPRQQLNATETTHGGDRQWVASSADSGEIGEGQTDLSP